MAKNPYQSAVEQYQSKQFKNDPIKAMAKMMGLKGQLSEIRKNQDKVFPIMCGVILYRHLSKAKKRNIMMRIHELPTSRLQGKLVELIAQNTANPYWNIWSLSADELNYLFKNSKKTHDWAKWLGIDFNITPGEITLAAVVVTFTGLLNDGAMETGRKIIRSRVDVVTKSGQAVTKGAAKLGVKRSTAVTFGVGYGIAAILCSAMMVFSKQDMAQAKEERDRRIPENEFEF